jgi:hypothetical protein
LSVTNLHGRSATKNMITLLLIFYRSDLPLKNKRLSSPKPP